MASPSPPDRGYDIVMENVTWTYSGAKEPAIKNVNLKVSRGEILIITGPSGAGKTTLCRCLNGLIPHFFRGELQGNIWVSGLSVRDYDTPVLSGKVGLCFDNPSNQLFCTSVLEELAFGPENYCLPREEIRARVDYALDFSRLHGYEMKSPHSLSGGQQQACAIAAIAAMHPEILALDEPTSNLDPYGTELVFQRINDIVRKEAKTMVIVEHKLDEILPLADRLVVMSRGEIVSDGPPLRVLERVEFIERLELQIPHATQLAYRFREAGFRVPRIPITVNEGVEFVKEFLASRNVRLPSKVEARAQPPSGSRPVAVKCEDVWYTYKDGTEAIKGISLEIREGEFIGFIGRNGSGKTTLAKMLNGLYKPTQGRVFVFGLDTLQQEISTLATYVGYTFQNPDDQLFGKTVREELEFGPKNLRLDPSEIRTRVDGAATELELSSFLDRSPFVLSQGLRQRVAVGSVLTMNPKVLVIDEPTTGQDYMRAKTIMEMAKKQNQKGTTIIVITHSMDLIAEYADRIFVFLDGKILLSGTGPEVFSQPDILIQSSIRPPQITRIFQGLSGADARTVVLTVADALRVVGITRGA